MGSRFRSRRLIAALLGLLTLALVLALVWFRGLHPARGLEQGEVAQVVMATNRLAQSLWETGYHPEDCIKASDWDPQYTCRLTGQAEEQVREAVKGPSRSYYVLVRPWAQEPLAEEPVHILSLQLAGGGWYLIAIRSLEEADQGIFYGYRAAGESIQEREIRWFRYLNPVLGRVLRDLRAPR